MNANVDEGTVATAPVVATSAVEESSVGSNLANGFGASMANEGTRTAEEDSHRHIEPPLGDLYQCDIKGALNRVETLAEELAKGGTLVWDPTKTTDDQLESYLARSRLQTDYSFYNFSPLGIEAEADDEYVCPMERVLQELHSCGYNLDAALRSLEQKGLKWHPQRPSHRRWRRYDIEQLERVLAVCPYPNKFVAAREMALPHKSLEEIIEFYYWKKGQDCSLDQDDVPPLDDLGTPEPEPLFSMPPPLAPPVFVGDLIDDDDLDQLAFKKRKREVFDVDSFTPYSHFEPQAFVAPHEIDPPLEEQLVDFAGEPLVPSGPKRAKFDYGASNESPVMSPHSDMVTAVPSSPDDEVSVDSFVALNEPVGPSVISQRHSRFSDDINPSRCSTPESECGHNHPDPPRAVLQ